MCLYTDFLKYGNKIESKNVMNWDVRSNTGEMERENLNENKMNNVFEVGLYHSWQVKGTAPIASESLTAQYAH